MEIAVAYNDDMFAASDVHCLTDIMCRSAERLLDGAKARARPKGD